MDFVSLSLTIISLLIGIVSFFLVRFFNSVEALKNVIQEHNVINAKLISKLENMGYNCDRTHKVLDYDIKEINKNIKEHDRRLDDHGKELVIIKSKLK
jgi:tRNA G26 N,N-dimethylase Trm1